jgi:hypothetical protein
MFTAPRELGYELSPVNIRVCCRLSIHIKQTWYNEDDAIIYQVKDETEGSISVEIFPAKEMLAGFLTKSIANSQYTKLINRFMYGNCLSLRMYENRFGQNDAKSLTHNPLYEHLFVCTS